MPLPTRRKPRLLAPALAAAVAATAFLTAPAEARTEPTAAPGATAGAAAPGDSLLPKPVPAKLGLVVEEYAQFPKSEPTPPPDDPRLMRHARINALAELPDGSGRKAVPDLNGKLYLVEDGEQPRTYLDVGATFAPQFFSGKGLGQGFGYAAFHPDFARNGIFYTVHTELASTTDKQPDLTPQPNTGYHGIITEWTAEDPAAGTFSGTRREVLRLGFNGRIHGIQQIAFNPTARKGSADYGKLYLAVGDGGTGVRTTEPQDLALPHGKLLRIDPRGSNSANGKYGVPADNPFADRPGALGEVYAYGFRDPHRFSWDTGGKHRLYLGHIGEHAIESIYEVRAGDNLGWSEREGPFVFDKNPADPCDAYKPLPPDDDTYGYTYPVAAYDHDPPADWNCTSDVGRAVSGGFVYRGDDLSQLRGTYLFGDLVDGRVFGTKTSEMNRGAEMATIHQLRLFDGATGNLVTAQDLAGDTRVDLRFGQDSAGELYLLAKANGKIWKVTGTRGPALP